jgi:glycosyltransferase involved in cell wall biosynthesis
MKRDSDIQIKKVAFVSNSAWSVWNFRREVVKSLLDAKLRVYVIAADDEYAVRLESMGCTVIRIPFDNRSKNLISDLIFFRRLKKVYKQLRPDFIFHYVAKPNIYGSLAAEQLNIPSVAVVTGLGYGFAKQNWLSQIMQMLYRRAFRKVNEVWFLNNDDAKIFADRKIISIDRMKVLPGEGVNVGHFAASHSANDKGSFRFLMSSRLLKSKGIGLYAQAARILRKKNYDISCGLIGFFEVNHPDSISEAELHQWEKECGVKYFGFAEDVRPFLRDTDCFVFPSYYNEGVPRCLLEAASMSVPIITSNNRGCKEVVLNNSNGYLCNVNDPFDLADKMERMMQLTTEQRLRMGANGRALVIRQFNIDKLIAIYHQTLDIPFAD